MSRRNADPNELSCSRYSRRGGVGTLTFQGRISVGDAETVLEAGRAAIADELLKTLHINCEAVEHADLSSLQILMSLAKGFKARGIKFDLVGPAATQAKKAFDLVGLAA